MTTPSYEQKHIVVPAAVHAEIKRQATKGQATDLAIPL